MIAMSKSTGEDKQTMFEQKTIHSGERLASKSIFFGSFCFITIYYCNKPKYVKLMKIVTYDRKIYRFGFHDISSLNGTMVT